MLRGYLWQCWWRSLKKKENQVTLNSVLVQGHWTESTKPLLCLFMLIHPPEGALVGTGVNSTSTGGQTSTSTIDLTSFVSSLSLWRANISDMLKVTKTFPSTSVIVLSLSFSSSLCLSGPAWASLANTVPTIPCGITTAFTARTNYEERHLALSKN